jgi:hypothetical protein
VSSSRIAFAAAELLVSARMISSAELDTAYSLPCWLAMITMPRSPLPIVAIGTRRPEPLAAYSPQLKRAAPLLRCTYCFMVLTS